MKKPTAGTAPPKTIDDYLAAAPVEKRAGLRTLRKMIKAAAPKATEQLSYGIAVFKYKGEPLIYYGHWKTHYGLYGMGHGVIDACAAELKGYVMSKGTVRFPADRPIPVRLVTTLVKARVAEVDRAN